jgi:hypothetical protein
LGSGKHTVRVEATDENGVAASAEVELTLTIPPTPAPTIPPTPQPTPTASPASVLNGGVTIPALALILIIVGLALLLILMGLVAYFLFFRAKQPVVQVMSPAPPPPSISPMIPIDDEAKDVTMIENYAFQPPPKKENLVHQAALAVVAGHGALSQTNFNLTKSEIKIGRNNKDIVNDIPVEDREVSRSHAKIVYRNQQYFIQDLGSSTGTTVNGVKLKAFQDIAIQNGAEIAVGPRVKFKFISMRLPSDPGVTLDDSSQDEIRPEDDDPHRTLFDY